jgi:4-amino-4-deoxy-L-arabinose transferase-like glycosyltransferase
MMVRLLASPRLISLLLTTTFLLHLLVAVSVPLTVDEAHYALYGIHLDWSYFDHPPLVGWLQALVLTLGEQEWQLRLWALFSYALSLWLIYGYTRYLTQSLASANLAALLFSCMPIVHVLGIGLVPDTLLLPLSIALIWQAQRTLAKATWQNWMLMGVLLGLSALSKYTAVLFVFGLLLLMLTHKDGWRHLITFGFWLAVLVAAIMSLPILTWNLEHDWISINYQLNHGHPEAVFNWLNVGQSQLGQMLLYTPLIWFTAWLSLFMVGTAWKSPNYRQLLLFILPAVLVFSLSSGKEPSLPHWLAFFYVLLLPLIAHQIMQGAHWMMPVTTANLLYGFALTLLVVILSLFPKMTAHWSPNPTQDLIGWKQAAEIGQSLRQDNESLIVIHWVDASRIAWYARPTSVVVMDERYDQFDIWFGSPNRNTHGILVIPPDKRVDDWQGYFAHCQALAQSGDGFHFLRCKDVKLNLLQ